MRDQLRMRFTADADPRFCARAFCRVRRMKRATHVVTLGSLAFRLCASCARPYESVRGATVAAIPQEVANA